MILRLGPRPRSGSGAHHQRGDYVTAAWRWAISPAGTWRWSVSVFRDAPARGIERDGFSWVSWGSHARAERRARLFAIHLGKETT